jgi:sterol 3beta-glucosyltransferase
LVEFLVAGSPPVYVGFGSMAGRNPEKVTQIVFESLARSGQRGVIATGWGGLAVSDLPDNLFKIESIPHDWLFPQMVAVVHHGGAGTTAAGLRAGKPTVICPFFGDQPFWGRRVFELGVGPEPIPHKKLSVEKLANAIQVAVSDDDIRKRAAGLGEKIRAENGIARAVDFISDQLANWFLVSG